MPFEDLFEEGRRQLTVCNSCRYCAGYCPVWPSMEKMTQFTVEEQTHLANLCYDCRDCFTACMYTAPHEFDLNPPKVFTSIRERTYAEYIRPTFMRKVVESTWGNIAIFVAAFIGVAIMAVLSGGSLLGDVDGHPYRVLDHTGIIVSAMAASLFAIGVTLAGMARYWRETHGRIGDLFNVGAWVRSWSLALQLKHQTGAEEGCSYENNQPGGSRKLAHQLIMGGFGLTFASTTVAAFLENFLGKMPPYPYLSAPVILGTVGGLIGTVGCVMSLQAKGKADPAQTTKAMLTADKALIWALFILNVSGLMTLFFRDTAAFGIIFVGHFAAVLVFFVFAPYTKFVHWVFRVMATYKDVLETSSKNV